MFEIGYPLLSKQSIYNIPVITRSSQQCHKIFLNKQTERTVCSFNSFVSISGKAPTEWAQIA